MKGVCGMKKYQRIRDLREDSDMTQQELCDRLQMHKTTYTNYEQGKHTVPLDFALTLADYDDVSIDYIAGRTQFKHSMYREGLSEDEQRLLEQYRRLSERSKGRVDQFVDQLAEGRK